MAYYKFKVKKVTWKDGDVRYFGVVRSGLLGRLGVWRYIEDGVEVLLNNYNGRHTKKNALADICEYKQFHGLMPSDGRIDTHRLFEKPVEVEYIDIDEDD
jgi:hypothetical protein